MILGNIWGLLGLLSIPAIIILHLYRQRFQPKQTSALFLFGPEQFNQASGRTRERLRRTGSLIAELLAALALTWFLCDPHMADYQQAKHLIYIVDGHQRLQAVDEQGRSVQDRARESLNQMLNQLNSHDRITLIQSGHQPSLLTATAVTIPQAKIALQHWQADQPWHSMQASIAMASDLQAASEQAQVVVLSDQQHRDLPEQWQCLSFGRALPNSGIIDARWFDDEQGQRVNIRLFRSSDKSTRAILLNDQHGKTLVSHKLQDQQGQQNLLIPLHGITVDRLSIQLSGTDHLLTDNSCDIIKPPKQMIRVSLVDDIKQREHILRALKATRQVHIVKEAAHIHISDKAASSDPGTWLIRFDQQDSDAVIGPFLARSGHPLLQDVDFTGCLWSGGHSGFPRDMQALLQAGDTCLMSETRQQGNRILHWYLDLDKSSLHRHPAWPSLFANLVQWRLHYLPGLQHYQLSSNMTNRMILPPDAHNVELHYPNTEIQELSADLQNTIDLPRLKQPGLYQVFLKKEQSSSAWQKFIVHALHKNSTDLSSCRTETPALNQSTEGKVQRIRTRLEHMAPLAIAILAALAAWFCYRNEQGLSR